MSKFIPFGKDPVTGHSRFFDNLDEIVGPNNIEYASKILPDILPGELADILPGELADILPGELADILPGILNDILPGILNDILPGIISGLLPSPSWAYFQANSKISDIIQWQKIAGSDDITVSNGTVTLANGGIYEIAIAITSASLLTPRNLTLQVPANGSAVAACTDVDLLSSVGQNLVYLLDLEANQTFNVDLNAGFRNTSILNSLSVKKVADL